MPQRWWNEYHDPTDIAGYALSSGALRRSSAPTCNCSRTAPCWQTPPTSRVQGAASWMRPAKLPSFPTLAPPAFPRR